MTVPLYRAIEFLEQPPPPIDRFVMIPTSWILLHSSNQDKVMVRYPTEILSVIKGLVKGSEPPSEKWDFYSAKVKSQDVDYELAKKYITWLKIGRELSAGCTKTNIDVPSANATPSTSQVPDDETNQLNSSCKTCSRDNINDPNLTKINNILTTIVNTIQAEVEKILDTKFQPLLNILQTYATNYMQMIEQFEHMNKENNMFLKEVIILNNELIRYLKDRAAIVTIDAETQVEIATELTCSNVTTLNDTIQEESVINTDNNNDIETNDVIERNISLNNDPETNNVILNNNNPDKFVSEKSDITSRMSERIILKEENLLDENEIEANGVSKRRLPEAAENSPTKRLRWCSDNSNDSYSTLILISDEE